MNRPTSAPSIYEISKSQNCVNATKIVFVVIPAGRQRLRVMPVQVLSRTAHGTRRSPGEEAQEQGAAQLSVFQGTVAAMWTIAASRPTRLRLAEVCSISKLHLSYRAHCTTLIVGDFYLHLKSLEVSSRCFFYIVKVSYNSSLTMIYRHMIC